MCVPRVDPVEPPAQCGALRLTVHRQNEKTWDSIGGVYNQCDLFRCDLLTVCP